MSQNQSDEDVCQLCHSPRNDHQRRHPFVGAGTDIGSAINNDKKNQGPAAVRIGSSGDPVLRMVLISKGLITLADLIAAEEEIDASRQSGKPVFSRPPEAGHPADSSAHT